MFVWVGPRAPKDRLPNIFKENAQLRVDPKLEKIMRMCASYDSFWSTFESKWKMHRRGPALVSVGL
jgi:hypothetical protein